MTTTPSQIDRSNLMYHLGVTVRRWRQVLDAEFHRAGLTDATWRPLLHLHLLGDGIRQKDLAASVGIEGPSLVRLVDTLETKGLIARTEDPGDRRSKLLTLTPDGARLVTEIKQTVTELENQFFAPFSDADIEELAKLVAALGSRVDQVRRLGRS